MGRSGRCSASRSPSPRAECVHCSVRTAPGKTTVARVASGLVTPTSGRLLVPARTSRAPGVEAGAARRGACRRRSLGVRLAVRRGQLAAVLPPIGRRRGPGDAWRARTRASPASGSDAGRRQGRCPAASSGCWPSRACWPTLPSVLIADELSLGLAPVIVDDVYATLEHHSRRGHLTADRRAAGAACDRARGHRGRARQRARSATPARRARSAISSRSSSRPSSRPAAHWQAGSWALAGSLSAARSQNVVPATCH